MKSFISHYGWIVVTVICLLLLITMAYRYGDYIGGTNDILIGELNDNTEGLIQESFDAFKTKYKIYVEESEFGKIITDKESYDANENILCTLEECKDGYKLTGVDLIDSMGNVIDIDNLDVNIGETFIIKCPESGITIIPVFIVKGG